MIGTKTRAGRALTALAAVPLLITTTGGIAAGDDIYNDLDTSIDAVAEVMSLNVGGGTKTTSLYVSPANGDGKNGCNLTSSSSLTLGVASSNTAAATVSPSSVTFTSCSDSKLLTVTPVAEGSSTISVTQTANNTGATFNLAPATFTANVAAPANTAPGISVTGVTGGDSYSKGSVPAAMCQVTDAEDGNKSFAATLSAVTGPYSADGIGSQTASCSYTDAGKLNAAASETYSIVDRSAPVIGYTLNPTAPSGANDWYKGNVTLDWTVSEPQSPSSLQKTGCVDQSITADQAATTYTCSATSAGGSAVEQSVTIKRDATAPRVSYDGVSPANPDGANGWYKSAVTATFTGTDGLSGIDGSATQNIGSGTAQGSNVTLSAIFSDMAGNSNSASSPSFKIDLTDPTNVTFVGGPDANGRYVSGSSIPSAPTCTADDTISGFEKCVVTGYSTAVGTHTLTATATDNAGRTATATRQYTVTYRLEGFFAPVDRGIHNTVKAGATVPLKFRIFDGATEVTDVSKVASFIARKVTCATVAGEDAIEETSTAVTGLRYDTIGGQFQQNWKTPKTTGCYDVTVTMVDGSKITAMFLLK